MILKRCLLTFRAFITVGNTQMMCFLFRCPLIARLASSFAHATLLNIRISKSSLYNLPRYRNLPSKCSVRSLRLLRSPRSLMNKLACYPRTTQASKIFAFKEPSFSAFLTSLCQASHPTQIHDPLVVLGWHSQRAIALRYRISSTMLTFYRGLNQR